MNTEQEKRSHQKKYLLQVLPVIQEKLEEENQKTMAAVVEESIEYIKDESCIAKMTTTNP